MTSTDPFKPKPDQDRHLKNVKAAAHKALLEQFYFRSYKSDFQISVDDLYIVWFNYTLGNFKALLSRDYKDGVYVEVTFDRRTESYYVDIYQKQSNIAIGSETLYL